MAASATWYPNSSEVDAFASSSARSDESGIRKNLKNSSFHRNFVFSLTLKKMKTKIPKKINQSIEIPT